jgi:She9 / Mdm33 family
MHRSSIRLYQRYSAPSHSSWWDRFARVWNERTGVAEMAALKESVHHAHVQLEQAVQDLSTARAHLDQTWNATLQLQREHADLLRQRDRWSNDEANRFASLLQREVTLRQDLETAQMQSRQAERTAASCQLSYIDQLRRRYQEETIWQDTWRILGTYGTWTLIAFNSVVFGASQYLHQRREIERVQHMERLLLLNQQQQQQQQERRSPPTRKGGPQEEKDEEESGSSIAEEATKTSVETSNEENAVDHAAGDDNPKAVTKTKSFWSRRTMKRWWSDTLRRVSPQRVYVDYLQRNEYFHLHVPSAVLGAALGGTATAAAAAATVLVVLLASRRQS